MLFELHKNILADCGVALVPGMQILDWGCGEGAFVAEGRAAGFQVVGCDFGAHGAHLSAIDQRDYRLPYADQSVDVVVSNQVLEHVMDYDRSLAELQRVLKTGGAFLHLFPSRWMPIEPHVYVPLATVLRGRSWLYLWALAGVRNEFQRGKPARETALLNYEYLRAHTNYLPRREIMRRFRRYFVDVHFVPEVWLRHSPSRLGRAVHALARALPFLPAMYGAFRGRVLFGRAPTR